jgi:16S rRNA (adenine1518-N6/adenine1519-N6)-dimethyltransferase
LREQFAADPGVTVIEADVLDVDLRTLTDARPSAIKVIGNIPYNITTPIIFRLLERDFRPHSIVLMIQREVADRIVAEPGTGDYGALSVGVRSVAHVERLFHVGRGSFRPVPRVDSTVIRITPFSPPRLSAADEDALRELTRVAFSRRRKQLQKILRSAPEYALDADAVHTVEQRTGIALEQRPEQLAPEQLVSLVHAVRAVRTEAAGRQ